MSLTIVVKSASNLPNVEVFSKSDPFTVVTYQGREKRTKVIDDDLNPVWNESLTWDVPGGISAKDSLEVQVYDFEKIGRNRFLGKAEVPLIDLFSRTKVSVTQALYGMKGKHLNATIALELTYKAPQSSHDAIGVEKAIEGDEQEEMAVVGGGDGGDANEEANSNEMKTETTGRKRTHNSSLGVQKSKYRLPDKLTDFQVRVHVLEARKLVGGNLNTTVKVTCGKHNQQTSTQKGTDNPVFDDVLFFNFREYPNKMLDQIVDIKVYSAKKVVANALIGSFSFDLCLVYDEVEHCFIHKWLLLTHPTDPSGGTKGYLKISIQVLGPGDNPKHSPSQTEIDQDGVDIEANLLRPSGVRLVPATLSVHVYRGEDLPRMDSGYFEAVKRFLHIGTVQKDLVDPYCSVTFAGHKGKTCVIWNDHNPKWNQQINLGVRFPSMCERLRLRLKDKDKSSQDDIIGTCYLNMSDISSPGKNGFLPTFGPCFINCYGSPREYSDLPDKYEQLNEGLFEGVAYRGRVMVELSMSLGKLPTTITQGVKKHDLNNLTPFLRRRKYKLFGTFLSATKLHPHNQPIEFEVSIGNCGNKLDEHSLPQMSTTPPSNPIFDGNQYYYLPWLDKKPSIEIDCQWEDCSYRIDSLNLILFTLDNLNTSLNLIKKMMQDKSEASDVKERLRHALQFFSDSISQPLPKLPRQGCTKLDKLIRKHREQELADMHKDCNSLLKEVDSIQISETVSEIEVYLNRLKNLAYEPQNSIPDVIVWMLSDNRRVAVKRIASHELMYSSSGGKFRGKHCGQPQTLYLTPPGQKDSRDVKDGAQVRIVLWLGLEKDQKEYCSGGEVVVLAETYENEAMNILGQWSKGKPHWSDAWGKVKQPKESFEPPPRGWKWASDWQVKPEQSITFEPEDGHENWVEEVFENQTRSPLSNWPGGAASFWTDSNGTRLVKCIGKEKKEISRDEIEPPDGWKFKDGTEWKIDINRAVDEDGWEFIAEFGQTSQYDAVEKSIHLGRRRRWTRVRVRDFDSTAVETKKDKHKNAIKEGWEYTSVGSSSFHIRRGIVDTVRRRRHVRELSPEVPGEKPLFQLGSSKKGDKGKKKGEEDTSDEEGKYLVPRMYVNFKDCHTYQLRAYLYQARDMCAGDNTGLSDPYAVMSFDRYSTRSRVVQESLSPTFDQTLIIKKIRLFGDTKLLCYSPPPVVFEFFDEDELGKDEYLGTSTVIPVVRLTEEVHVPQLDWVEIVRFNKSAGEVLVACELSLDDGAKIPMIDLTESKAPHPQTHYHVPSCIRPESQNMRIELICWGVRDMKPFQVLPVSSPHVEVECGDVKKRLSHNVIMDKDKNPNNTETVISFEMNLPKKELYSPPLNLRIFDNRIFGYSPMVGVHVVKSLKDFITELRADRNFKCPANLSVRKWDSNDLQHGEKEVVIHMDGETVTHAQHTKTHDDESSDPDTRYKSDFDWWSKYYCSIEDKRRKQTDYIEKGYDLMMVYDGNLETVFNGFTDFVETFPLYRGKGLRDPEDKDGQPVGYFKGSLKVYKLQEEESLLPELNIPSIPSSVEVVVRVYIIRGIDLEPRDPDGKSDPYIKISIGRKVIDDKDNYVPGDLNPIFGKMFELPATFPTDHTLTVSVMDWDRFSADDLIGETKIDLENRFLSHHRATCGLPLSYSMRGPNKWRDVASPLDILQTWVGANNLEWEQADDGTWTSVKIDGKYYTLDEFEQDRPAHPDRCELTQQRLALHVLHQLKPELVPEHIETRNLYSPTQPGIPQGQLHMWVDIFNKNDVIPPPVDISPRKPQKYELRVVVWNTKVSTNNTTDIYVKGWVRGEDETQKTDVHYRSMDGEGNFNWRLVFPLEYLPAENIMVVKKKEHFYSLTKVEHHLPPMITMQVWDNDIFTPDDFIGTINIDLSDMPLPVKRSRSCTLHQLPEGNSKAKTDNLFKRKRMAGWWPVHGPSDKKRKKRLKGKLELEFELLTEEEALARPAAKARDEPNQNPKLEPPHRPKTSFLWISSPWKSFRFIIWREHKCLVIFLILLTLLLIPIIGLIV